MGTSETVRKDRMPFLSVIIPVYKVEPYLRQCVDSVLNQQLSDFELILVDDGSPDRCPKICDDYIAQYQQIRVVHQKNGGLSLARNTGIKVALGDYIIFMDSDDWWNPEVRVRRMLDTVRAKPEVEMFLFSGLDFIQGDGYFDRVDSIRKLTDTVTDAISYYKVMLASGNLQVSACTKILKKSFILANGLLFMEELLGEDNEWMIRLLRCVSNVALLSDSLYICRLRRSDSITNTIKKKNVEDLLKIVSSSICFWSDADENEKLMELEYCFCAYLWFCALGLSNGLTVNEQESIKEDFKRTARVCSYSWSRKTRLAYSVYKRFGLRATGIVLGTYIRLKSKFRLNKKRVT